MVVSEQEVPIPAGFQPDDASWAEWVAVHQVAQPPSDDEGGRDLDEFFGFGPGLN